MLAFLFRNFLLWQSHRAFILVILLDSNSIAYTVTHTTLALRATAMIASNSSSSEFVKGNSYSRF